MSARQQKSFRFWQELKRRNVPRVLAIYAGTAFVILEASDIIFPRWGLPDWTVNMVLYLLVVGAVITLVLSWTYDLSPGGFVRTGPEETVRVQDAGEVPGSPVKGKKIRVSSIIIAVLIVVIGLLMYPKIFRNSHSPLNGKNRSSIAVLPLKIIGDDAELSFFASGLVESLTYMLSRVGNAEQSFSVIPPSEITGAISADEARKRFGVSLVISGSIQMDQASSRLILNLIDAKTQNLIRSEKLDYPKNRNLIIQDEVISVMVSMLGLELGPGTKQRITRGGSSLYEANELYLIGKGILREGAESITDIDEAIDLFKQAIEKDPLFALAYAGMGSAFNLKYHFTSDVAWIDESLKYSRRAVELNDQDAMTLEALANSLVEKGEFEEALSYFEKSRAIDSSNYAIYSDMAYLYELEGDPVKAEEQYKRAVGVDPDSHIAHYYLGVFYYYQARYDEAIAEIEKALELSPGHLAIMNVLGACYFGFEDFDKAIAIFNGIIEQDSTQGQVFQNLGALYYFTGNFDHSVYNYQEALRLLPSSYSVQSALGRAFLAGGNRSLANESFRKAISLGHQDFTCPDLQFAAWFGWLGMTDSADFYLQRAGLEVHPDSVDASVAYSVGETYMILERNSQALPFLESALKRGYGWIEIRHSPIYMDLAHDKSFQDMIARSESAQGRLP
jgi:tetratricopeptide (TPR) repeat protein/TolB-like protein